MCIRDRFTSKCPELPPLEKQISWCYELVFAVLFLFSATVNTIVNQSIYFAAFILPFITVNVPTPSYVLQPKILKLIRAPRPGFKHWGVHSSPGRLHIRTRLSMPTSTLHSSLKITLFQWSVTVLFLFNLHHARRFLTFSARLLMAFFTTHLRYPS